MVGILPVMMLRSLLACVLVMCAVFAGAGCSTVITPTRPSIMMSADGPPLSAFRFDGTEVSIREPGMPVSPSRTWQREVSNYTARSLNTLLTTNDNASAATTVVTFDLAGPSTFQIGTWKEMTITLSSTLPDGTVVKSAPVIGNVDDAGEYALITGLGIGSTVLNVTAGIASIFFIFQQQNAVTGAVFIGSLLGGLGLNIGQSVAQYGVAGSEEVRWSNLFRDALIAHANDVRARQGSGPPLPTTTLPTTTLPAPPRPTAPVAPTAPPPVLDPAEVQ